ncbi:GntR family transcriptional regulator [Nonomuraea sp. K274]|uniref:GntR family transcriptional regulator n=2 Tax=Nonomuraea cypriaca TaxID=1187855 RepID=A0A931F2S8_9ACTN|nr:GntR family transcriptional regulator [Nonomuraea cypriaca]
MYDVLLDQFMAGKRAPGEPLNIGALSRELDVSQTPLREALARLEHTGLVVREALKGYRVAPMFTEREVAKLMDARIVLEPALTYETCRRTTPEFLEELRLSVEELDESAGLADTQSSSFRHYWAADDRFHMLIAQQSDNPFLETAYRSLNGQMQRFRLFSKLGNTGAHHAAKEHRAIHDALVEGNPEIAAIRMREHLQSSNRRRTQS